MISITNLTGRNTNARVVTIKMTELFFSYETLIAVRSVEGCYRVENSWGPTTGRHINEMSCRNFKVVSREKLQDFAMASLAKELKNV